MKCLFVVKKNKRNVNMKNYLINPTFAHSTTHSCVCIAIIKFVNKLIIIHDIQTNAYMRVDKVLTTVKQG